MEQLMCGAAKEKITPPEKMLPISSINGRRLTGVKDDIFVRVIALKAGDAPFLLISFDLGGAPKAAEWVTNISEKHNIPAENIMYFATHTHSAPMIGPFGHNAPAQDSSLEQICYDALLKAVSDAIERMQPAKFGYGTVNSYLNVNRNVLYRERDKDNHITREYCGVGQRFEGPSDKTLAVLRFENLFGDVIAFLINYPMHLVAMHRNHCGDGGMAISSDIGGLACQYMEKRFEGAVALWSSGAAGDQNPIMMNRLYYPSPENNEMLGAEANDYELCVAQAARHFDDILLANDSIAADCREVIIKSGVDYSRTPARTVDLHGDKDALGRNIEQYEYAPDPLNTYDVRLQVMQLGDVALVGVSGELYNSIGTLMREVSPTEKTIIITHAQGNDGVYSGYIFDDEGCVMGGNGGLAHAGSRILPGYVPAEMCRVMLNLLRNFRLK